MDPLGMHLQFRAKLDPHNAEAMRTHATYYVLSNGATASSQRT